MSLSPTPDTLFFLPTNSFSIPVPQTLTGDTDHDSRTNLRVQVKVAVLLPSSLVGTKPRKRWGMERNFDVVLPIGGKVEMGVRVKEEGLGLLWNGRSPGDGARQDEIMEEGSQRETVAANAGDLVETALRKLLRSNKETLGIKRISRLSNASHSVHESRDSLAPFTVYSLHCLTAQAARSPLANDTIMAGTPVAYLHRIEITLGWYRPKKRPLAPNGHLSSPLLDQHEKTDGADSNATDNAITDDDHGIDDLLGDLIDDDDDDDDPNDDDPYMRLYGNEDLLLDEEDELFVTSEHRIMPGQMRQAARMSPGLDQSGLLANGPPPDCPTGSDDAPQGEGSSLVPAWAKQQIEAGLQKLLRTHMIKRFPLIFDGGFILYMPKLAAPKALASSLSRFINTSERYQTLLHAAAFDTLQDMWLMQETEASDKVRSLVEMLSRKHRSTPPGSDDSQSSQTRKRKRGTPVVEPDEMVRQYARDLRCGVRERVTGRPGSHEGLIRWVLRDATMDIGRAEWALRRGSGGKMTASRIPLAFDYDDEQDELDEEELSQESQYRAIDLDLRSLHIDKDPDDNDLILDDAHDILLEGDDVDAETLVGDEDGPDKDVQAKMIGSLKGNGLASSLMPEKSAGVASNTAGRHIPTSSHNLSAQERLDQLLAQERLDQEALLDNNSILGDEEDNLLDVIGPDLQDAAIHHQLEDLAGSNPLRGHSDSMPTFRHTPHEAYPSSKPRCITSSRVKDGKNSYHDFDLTDFHQAGTTGYEHLQVMEDHSWLPDDGSELLNDVLAGQEVDDQSSDRLYPESDFERDHGQTSSPNSAVSTTSSAKRGTGGTMDGLKGGGNDVGHASDWEMSYRSDDVFLLPSRLPAPTETSQGESEHYPGGGVAFSALHGGIRYSTPPLVPDDDGDAEEMLEDGVDDLIDDGSDEEPEAGYGSLDVIFPFQRHIDPDQGGKSTRPDEDGFDWTPRMEVGSYGAGSDSMGDFDSLASVF